MNKKNSDQFSSRQAQVHSETACLSVNNFKPVLQSSYLRRSSKGTETEQNTKSFRGRNLSGLCIGNPKEAFNKTMRKMRRSEEIEATPTKDLRHRKTSKFLNKTSRSEQTFSEFYNLSKQKPKPTHLLLRPPTFHNTKISINKINLSRDLKKLSKLTPHKTFCAKYTENRGVERWRIGEEESVGSESLERIERSLAPLKYTSRLSKLQPTSSQTSLHSKNATSLHSKPRKSFPTPNFQNHTTTNIRASFQDRIEDTKNPIGTEIKDSDQEEELQMFEERLEAIKETGKLFEELSANKTSLRDLLYNLGDSLYSSRILLPSGNQEREKVNLEKEIAVTMRETLKKFSVKILKSLPQKELKDQEIQVNRNIEDQIKANKKLERQVEKYQFQERILEDKLLTLWKSIYSYKKNEVEFKERIYKMNEQIEDFTHKVDEKDKRLKELETLKNSLAVQIDQLEKDIFMSQMKLKELQRIVQIKDLIIQDQKQEIEDNFSSHDDLSDISKLNSVSSRKLKKKFDRSKTVRGIKSKKSKDKEDESYSRSESLPSQKGVKRQKTKIFNQSNFLRKSTMHPSNSIKMRQFQRRTTKKLSSKNQSGVFKNYQRGKTKVGFSLEESFSESQSNFSNSKRKESVGQTKIIVGDLNSQKGISKTTKKLPVKQKPTLSNFSEHKSISTPRSRSKKTSQKSLGLSTPREYVKSDISKEEVKATKTNKEHTSSKISPVKKLELQSRQNEDLIVPRAPIVFKEGFLKKSPKQPTSFANNHIPGECDCKGLCKFLKKNVKKVNNRTVMKINTQVMGSKCAI
ncbi:unnamed protein product [Moneuplotes crassus]|uniref:Uncharacterized protein n=1 Tax=Euplotes crassus TaxID=5936 RepID=A0AAD1XFX7_EUPCR|nr:unnamed protein product [Moneuplotes crassus]